MVNVTNVTIYNIAYDWIILVPGHFRNQLIGPTRSYHFSRKGGSPENLVLNMGPSSSIDPEIPTPQPWGKAGKIRKSKGK